MAAVAIIITYVNRGNAQLLKWH